MSVMAEPPRKRWRGPAMTDTASGGQLPVLPPPLLVPLPSAVMVNLSGHASPVVLKWAAIGTRYHSYRVGDNVR
jgi:hypothetical protein